jgi:hypothetical protein
MRSFMQPVPGLSLKAVPCHAASEGQFAKPGHESTQAVSMPDSPYSYQKGKKNALYNHRDLFKPSTCPVWETNFVN